MRATPRIVELDLEQACRRLQEARAPGVPAKPPHKPFAPSFGFLLPLGTALALACWLAWPRGPSADPLGDARLNNLRPDLSWHAPNAGLKTPISQEDRAVVYARWLDKVEAPAERQWLVKLADWVRTYERPIDVRRAQLVGTEALSDWLVELAGRVSHPLVISEHRMLTLPDSTKVSITYKGVLSKITDLPTSANQMGDAWNISGSAHLWIWAIAKGQTQPYWIDP